MKGRKSSSNSRDGGKPRWKDKRKENFKIKWPCVRSGPITERKEERERERARERDVSPAMSVAIRILQNTEGQIPAKPRFFPTWIFRLLFPVSHLSHT